MTTDLQFPIGKFRMPETVTPEIRKGWIDDIRRTPALLREAVADLSDEQLDTPYRPDGWTVRQLVHHVPDSHINSYVRFKWALTEDKPTIKAYNQDRWAELPDGHTAPIDASLDLLDAVHTRWVRMLEALTEDQLKRPLVHPDSGPLTVEAKIGGYAWHGLHHVAHVTKLRERKGW